VPGGAHLMATPKRLTPLERADLVAKLGVLYAKQVHAVPQLVAPTDRDRRYAQINALLAANSEIIVLAGRIVADLNDEMREGWRCST